MSTIPVYPIGTPSQPWGDAERAEWRARQVRRRSHADDVLSVIDRLAGDWDVVDYGVIDAPPDRYPLRALRSRQWDDALSEMRADWPLAELRWDDARAAELAAGIFTRGGPAVSWKLFVRGTPFQLRVWRALLNVRPGSLVSYGKLAADAGNPNASRATGTAVGSNAISFLIPCHRVIRETGVSGQYRWGAVRKRAILAWESAAR